jgi:hypothetical protein
VKPELLEQLGHALAAVHALHPVVLRERRQRRLAGAGEDRADAHRVHELEVAEVREDVRDGPSAAGLEPAQVGFRDAVDGHDETRLELEQRVHAPHSDRKRCWCTAHGSAKIHESHS